MLMRAPKGAANPVILMSRVGRHRYQDIIGYRVEKLVVRMAVETMRIFGCETLNLLQEVR